MRFRHGLVVGKFSPLHRGHELVIRRAFELSDRVSIISYSSPEFKRCDCDRRELWLAALFPDAERLVFDQPRLRALFPDAPALPGNDAPDNVHRRFCAWLCRFVLRAHPDAVFTSETYGDGFAAVLSEEFTLAEGRPVTVQHVSVDLARRLAPTSGTELRRTPSSWREWLAPIVNRDLVRRICLLGGESTGKSTLTATLARVCNTIGVEEFGRELWVARDGRLQFDDMLTIAKTQAEREEEAALAANQVLFCDTSPLTTLFYSLHMFGRAADELEHLARRQHDLTVLCADDFEFVQDGTRQPPAFRRLQQDWYRRELAERGISFLEATGSVDDRLTQIRRAVSELLRN